MNQQKFSCHSCQKTFQIAGYSKHMMFVHHKGFSLKTGVRDLSASEVDRAEYLKQRWQMKGGSGEKRRAFAVPSLKTKPDSPMDLKEELVPLNVIMADFDDTTNQTDDWISDVSLFDLGEEFPMEDYSVDFFVRCTPVQQN